MTEVVETEKRCESILHLVTDRHDITLMDLQMSEMKGLDAMVTILGEFPDA